MNYHDLPEVRPYLHMGFSDESPEKLEMLEDVAQTIGRTKDPALSMAKGSILSEVADIYLLGATLDPEKAVAAMTQADSNYNRAARSSYFQHSAQRSVVFNSLRHARATGRLNEKLPPALKKLSWLGIELPYAPDFAPGDKAVGDMSELLVLTLSLWRAIDQERTGQSDRLQIAWPSYVRQKHGSLLKVTGNFQGSIKTKHGRLPNMGSLFPGIARNLNFDARLSTHDRAGRESIAARRPLKITTSKRTEDEQAGAPNSSVVVTRDLPGIERPDDMRAIFISMLTLHNNLGQERTERLRLVSQGLIEQATQPSTLL